MIRKLENLIIAGDYDTLLIIHVVYTMIFHFLKMSNMYYDVIIISKNKIKKTHDLFVRELFRF